ncbi:hypothetical protein KI387_002321 [Taxus chinensis]|uniref:Uncharacterized protein n=1 Tax=Taxus chinensis TaxID=29808 RepID=A0AA38LM70_TAXCH|nr:hypothetical protein KI387_002321 [Taxus chinensis]
MVSIPSLSLMSLAFLITMCFFVSLGGKFFSCIQECNSADSVTSPPFKKPELQSAMLTRLVIVILVLAMASPTATASTFTYWSAASAAFKSLRAISSLLHSLMTRVASLRASRGDSTGAQRARSIAEGFEGSVRWWRIVGSMGWDYIAHYAWRETLSRPLDYAQIMSSLNELLSAYGELMRVRSETEKVQWISQNYQRVLRISKLLLQKLLSIFTESGPLRESILAFQKEITEGDLIGDLLQLGVADVKGLLQVARDMMSRFFAPSSMQQESSRAEL